jgi:hypothetical protein
MLQQEILIAEVRKITDSSWERHEGWPTNFIDSAERWVNAFHLFMQTITPPSTTLGAAKVAALATPPAMADKYIPLAWKSYCLVAATGMQPTFTATAPIGLLDLSTVYATGLVGGSAEECAKQLARVTLTWIKTGVALPKSGPPILWS